MIEILSLRRWNLSSYGGVSMQVLFCWEFPANVFEYDSEENGACETGQKLPQYCNRESGIVILHCLPVIGATL